jgi:TFIIF-interacting CTD phosphatase-like protein
VDCGDNFFIKDLGIIQDRDLKDMVIVDNSIVSFAFNLDNGIPIEGFERQ